MPTPAPISIQLYSLRAEAATDFRSVLERLGRKGFCGVELAGFNNLEPAEFATIASDNGLRVSSAHVNLAKAPEFEATLDTHLGVGTTTMVVPFMPPESFATIEAIDKTAYLLNKCNRLARDRGIDLGYHNHFWEFSTVIDGRSAMSLLFDRLDETMFVELDIYWAKVGGADPVEVIHDFGDRVRLLHIKDGPADAYESDMVAVGSGVIDTRGAINAANNASWHIVELDRCATDMFEAVEASYDFLVGSNMSEGRT